MPAKNAKTDRPHVFFYQGTLPPALALLLVAPLLFVFLSVAAVLIAGGALAALGLPLVLRRRLRRPAADGDGDVVTLEPDQYSRVDPDAPKLPPR